MSLGQRLQSLPSVLIKQKKELAEIFGFETRNKYSIETEDGQQIAYAAEQQKGIFGFLFRQWLGHWRPYQIHIYGPDRQLEFVAHHPFRIYFQRLEIRNAAGESIGTLERRIEILGKRFDLMDPAGNILMTVRSPLWRLWTFPFKKNGESLAVVTKKWGGILKEAFLDADSFHLAFTQPSLTPEQRVLLLVSAIFIDLRFFEKKASGG